MDKKLLSKDITDYSQVNFECSVLATYTVVYLELCYQARDPAQDDENCLSKAITCLSKRAHNWVHF